MFSLRTFSWRHGTASEEFTLMYSTLQLTDNFGCLKFVVYVCDSVLPIWSRHFFSRSWLQSPPTNSPTPLPASEEAPVSQNMPTVCVESEGQLVCLLLRQQAWLQLSSLGMWCEWAQGLPWFWNDLDPIQGENTQKRQLCWICHHQYWEAVSVWLGKRGAAGNPAPSQGAGSSEMDHWALCAQNLPGGPKAVDPSLPFSLKTINIHRDFYGILSLEST